MYAVISIQLDNKYPEKQSVIYFTSHYQYQPYSFLSVTSLNALLLLKVKHPIILNDIHPFNWKSLTITSIGTLNTPGTNTSRYNALKMRRIDEAKWRRAGEACLNPVQNGRPGR
jgi:hypothetical protein